MRRLIAVLCCAALAACGGVPNSFSEPVKGRQSEVYGALSGFRGGLVPRLLSLPAIVRSSPDEAEVRYLLRSSDGKTEGSVTFEVEAAGENESLVTVEVDMPAVEADIDGTRKELSEAKAANQIRKAVSAWAEARAKGKPTSAKLAAIDDQLGYLLLALSPAKTKEAIRLARSGPAAQEFAEGYLAWNSDFAIEEQSQGFASDEQPGEERDGARHGEDDGGWGSAMPADAETRESRRKRRKDGMSEDWGA